MVKVAIVQTHMRVGCIILHHKGRAADSGPQKHITVTAIVPMTRKIRCTACFQFIKHETGSQFSPAPGTHFLTGLHLLSYCKHRHPIRRHQCLHHHWTNYSYCCHSTNWSTKIRYCMKTASYCKHFRYYLHYYRRLQKKQ